MAIIIGFESAREYYRLAQAGILAPPSPYDGDPRTRAVGGVKRAGGSILASPGVTVGQLEAQGIYPVPDWLHTRRSISTDEIATMLSGLSDRKAIGYKLNTPLDFVVTRVGARGENSTYNARVCGTSLPPHSFRQLSKGVFIVSPELLFLQMAREERSIHVIAAFGCELTGAYSLLPRGLVSLRRQLDGRDPHDTSWFTIDTLLGAEGYIECAPCTTYERLSKYLHALPPHTRGARRALKALRWVKDGSRSPMETVSSLQLRMPRLWGGFGAGDADFNVKQSIRHEWQQILKKDYLLIDELFVGRNGKVVAMEYNGGNGHSSRAQIMDDNQRRQALEDENIRVIFITARDFLDMRTWEQLGENLATYLGKQYGPPTPLMRERRLKMHADFSDPNFLK